MASDHDTVVPPLVRKLASISPLTQDEREALADLPMQVRQIHAGQDIVREGDRPSRSCLLLEGLAFRYKMVGADGRRQIMSFYIPGDIPDLMSLHLDVMDNSLATVSRCKVGFIEHRDLRRLIRHHPGIADALWRDTLIDSAVFREWLAGVGRRDAHSRIAHLFCEMFLRMQAVGLVDDQSIPLPVTQGLISDALGLSPVHVNRVVQALRSEGLIAWTRRVLTVHDLRRLEEVAEFDRAYLHLRDHAIA